MLCFFFIGCCIKSYPDKIVLFSDWLLCSPSLFFVWLISGRLDLDIKNESYKRGLVTVYGLGSVAFPLTRFLVLFLHKQHEIKERVNFSCYTFPTMVRKNRRRHFVSLTRTLESLLAPKIIAVTLSLLPLPHTPPTHTRGSTHTPAHKHKHQATYVDYCKSSAWSLRTTVKRPDAFDSCRFHSESGAAREILGAAAY